MKSYVLVWTAWGGGGINSSDKILERLRPPHHRCSNVGSISDHSLQREVGTASWASIWVTSGKPLNLSRLQCPFLKNRDAECYPAYHAALLGGPRRGWEKQQQRDFTIYPSAFFKICTMCITY